jgi:DNA invertase Pin-like site-specific DNA recombinase
MTIVSTRRAVGYCRVSTAEQERDEHYSIDEQTEAIRGYCVEHDLELVEVFAEQGSRSRASRAQYQRMLRFVVDREHGINTVIVRWLDRFGGGFEPVVRAAAFHDQGVQLIATDEDISHVDNLLSKAGYAAKESRRAAERIRRNLVRAAEMGVHFGALPCRLDGQEDHGHASAQLEQLRNSLIRVCLVLT